jgi:hypothetical protein
LLREDFGFGQETLKLTDEGIAGRLQHIRGVMRDEAQLRGEADDVRCLTCRTEGNVEKSATVSGRCSCTSFNDVDRNRGCGSADLLA